MVQRYELEEMSRNPFESYRCLEENDEGDWVKYEDYAKLELKYLQLANRVLESPCDISTEELAKEAIGL